ncbi:hypothetical protein RUM43_003903 [Polyplax serrata]|uniref:Uncharacterized protein n=1 Tax=Polyplax serrata TaxID=468196 RepID=A0AAN8Q760_POLSC
MTRAYYPKMTSSPFDHCPYCKPPDCGGEKKTPKGSTIEMRNQCSLMKEEVRFEALKRRQLDEPGNAEGDGHSLATSSKYEEMLNGKRRQKFLKKKRSLREIPVGLSR